MNHSLIVRPLTCQCVRPYSNTVTTIISYYYKDTDNGFNYYYNRASNIN